MDICRFLLPASSLANVGVTINARALEYAICKMLSSPLEEVQAIGEELRRVGQIEAPTLVKYAECNPYLLAVREKMRRNAKQVAPSSVEKNFQLISWDAGGEDKVLAGVLFRYSRERDFPACLAYVQGLADDEKESLVDDLMSDRGKFDQPLREFEYACMSFEVVMDQGAYFEFKRHRMMTQTVQPLSPYLGFAIPKGITAAGFEEDYRSVMNRAGEVFEQIAVNAPDAASYIIPNGYNRRVLFTLNLRQAYHLCRLRAAENAHFSIRRVAQQITAAIKEVYPLLGRYLDIPGDESAESVENMYFSTLRTG